MAKPIANDGRDDGTTAAAIHSDPVSQAGFTMIPNVVVLDQRLSLGAKLAYGYLKHIAWRTHNGTVESAVSTLCRDLGVSEKTMRGYLHELAAVDLIESKRRGLGLPNLYIVHDPPQDLLDGTVETPVQEGEDLRVSPSSTEEVSTREPPEGGPPKLLRVEGRDLAFDALAEVCRVDPAGNRAREVGYALNGTKQKGLPVGIRELAWRDLLTANASAEAMPPEAWERYLATTIRQRAELYERAMPGAALTPLALAKWWTDIGDRPPMASRFRYGRRDVSAAEMREAADRLRANDERRALESG